MKCSIQGTIMIHFFPYRTVTLSEIKQDLLSQLEIKNIKDNELFSLYIPFKITVNYKNHEGLNKYNTLCFYIYIPKSICIFDQAIFDLLIVQLTKEAINIFLQNFLNSKVDFYIKSVRLTHHQDFIPELTDRDIFHEFSLFSNYYNKIVYKMKNISKDTRKFSKYLAHNPVKFKEGNYAK